MGREPPPDQESTRRGSAVSGTSDNATCVLGTTGLFSSLRTPFLRSATLGLFIPVCFAQHVSTPCQRVREKEESCVIFPHAFRAGDARCTPGLGSAGHSLWAGGRGLVLCRVTLLLCNGKQLVAARCKGGSFASRLGEGRRRAPVCKTQLSLCRCCRCTVSLSPFARRFGSKPQTRVCLACTSAAFMQRCLVLVLFRECEMLLNPPSLRDLRS